MARHCAIKIDGMGSVLVRSKFRWPVFFGLALYIFVYYPIFKTQSATVSSEIEVGDLCLQIAKAVNENVGWRLFVKPFFASLLLVRSLVSLFHHCSGTASMAEASHKL